MRKSNVKNYIRQNFSRLSKQVFLIWTYLDGIPQVWCTFIYCNQLLYIYRQQLSIKFFCTRWYYLLPVCTYMLPQEGGCSVLPGLSWNPEWFTANSQSARPYRVYTIPHWPLCTPVVPNISSWFLLFYFSSSTIASRFRICTYIIHIIMYYMYINIVDDFCTSKRKRSNVHYFPFDKYNFSFGTRRTQSVHVLSYLIIRRDGSPITYYNVQYYYTAVGIRFVDCPAELSHFFNL